MEAVFDLVILWSGGLKPFGMLAACHRSLVRLKADVRAEIIEKARAVMCTIDTTCQLINVGNLQPCLDLAMILAATRDLFKLCRY